MSFKVDLIEPIKSELKKLRKKYPSFKADFEDFIISIRDNPFQGDSLGNSCFKVRMAITSKNKGKSGGARVITLLRVKKEVVYLLTIYDKSEKENISERELEILISNISE